MIEPAFELFGIAPAGHVGEMEMGEAALTTKHALDRPRQALLFERQCDVERLGLGLQSPFVPVMRYRSLHRVAQQDDEARGRREIVSRSPRSQRMEQQVRRRFSRHPSGTSEREPRPVPGLPLGVVEVEVMQLLVPGRHHRRVPADAPVERGRAATLRPQDDEVGKGPPGRRGAALWRRPAMRTAPPAATSPLRLSTPP